MNKRGIATDLNQRIFGGPRMRSYGVGFGAILAARKGVIAKVRVWFLVFTSDTKS